MKARKVRFPYTKPTAKQCKKNHRFKRETEREGGEKKKREKQMGEGRERRREGRKGGEEEGEREGRRKGDGERALQGRRGSSVVGVTNTSEALFSLISREAQRTRKLTSASGRNISSKALFSYYSENENLNGTD